MGEGFLTRTKKGNVARAISLRRVYISVQAIGVTILNGYGLTETSPVLAARVVENNVMFMKAVTDL